MEQRIRGSHDANSETVREESRLFRSTRRTTNETAPPTVIASTPAPWAVRLGEVWQYRELLYFLAWRDIKVRYKQAVLGVLWAIVQPFVRMVVFSLVFGRLVGIDSGAFPYPIFVFAGLLPWGLFADAVGRSAHSLVAGASIVRKAHVPRLIMPVASASATFPDFAVSFALLLGLMVYYGLPLTPSLLLVVPLTLMVFLVALGVGLFASALNAAYRDVQHVIPFLIQTWMFVTPVIYPVTAVPSRFEWVILANPMTGIIGAYRAVILGDVVPWHQLGVSSGIAVILLAGGLLFFRAMDRRFADVI
jgi:lipopolysaccharide transport system permease protein